MQTHKLLTDNEIVDLAQKKRLFKNILRSSKETAFTCDDTKTYNHMVRLYIDTKKMLEECERELDIQKYLKKTNTQSVVRLF